MNIKEITRITFNLVVIYAIGGLLLAWVYAKTSPVIFKINKEEKEAALKAMMPEAKDAPKLLGDWEPWHRHAEYYIVNGPDGSDTPLGYIAETYGKGYSSYIHLLVAVDNEMVVKKISVLGHGETPGLGDEIMLAWFKDQFVGKDLGHLVVIKGETADNIQAITGATISTRAVTNGVRDAIVMLGEAKKNPAASAEGENDKPEGGQEGGE